MLPVGPSGDLSAPGDERRRAAPVWRRRPGCGGRRGRARRGRGRGRRRPGRRPPRTRALRRGSPTPRGRRCSCRRSASSDAAGDEAQVERRGAEGAELRPVPRRVGPPAQPTSASAERPAPRRPRRRSPIHAPCPRTAAIRSPDAWFTTSATAGPSLVDDAQRRGEPRHAAAGVGRAVERIEGDHDRSPVPDDPLSSDSTANPASTSTDTATSSTATSARY